MIYIVLKSEKLNIPEEVAKKLKGKEVELIEVKEGIFFDLSLILEVI